MLKKSKYTVVGSNGRIVIPAEIRHRLNIKKGTRLYVQEHDREIIIRAITPEYIESLAGILAGHDLAKSLLEDRAEDREREDRG